MVDSFLPRPDLNSSFKEVLLEWLKMESIEISDIEDSNNSLYHIIQ